MKIEIDVPNRATSDEKLSSLMKDIGVDLLEPYRDFLLEQNGGVPVNGIFYYGDGGSSGVIFFGVDTGENYNDLKWNYEVYKDRIPKGFFPIGNDPGGNLICIDVKGDQSVYFWDHEREEQPPSRSNIYKIADSFEGFLALLKPDEDGEDW